jgi:hypothetical protein
MSRRVIVVTEVSTKKKGLYTFIFEGAEKMFTVCDLQVIPAQT